MVKCPCCESGDISQFDKIMRPQGEAYIEYRCKKCDCIFQIDYNIQRKDVRVIKEGSEEA